MKSKFFRLPNIAALGLALTFIASPVAAENVRYVAEPGSKVKIEGTSTIHDWTVEGQIIGGFMEVDSGFKLDPNLKSVQVAPKVQTTIPVRSLKSGKKRMDEVMQEAMKAKTHPKIDYQLLELKLKDAPTKDGGPAIFDATGTLTIAGVVKTNTFPVTMEKTDANKLKVTGSTKMKMTEYGIKPPAPEIALGLIKTGDDITVSFEWLTAPEVKK
jgi:polyisoprenoid-binding protein YceI